MADFGVKRNGSGYYDETAFKGITNVNTPKPGEIFSVVNSRKGTEEDVLIIKAGSKYCNVLRLTDDNYDGCIQIIGKSIKYTDPGMLSYMFNSNEMQFVKKIPDKDFKAIIKAVEAALKIDITVEVVEEKKVPVLAPVTVANAQNNEELHSLQMHKSNEELLKYRTLYETFKGLYDGLLERVMAK